MSYCTCKGVRWYHSLFGRLFCTCDINIGIQHVQNDLTLQVNGVIGSYVLNLGQPNLAYFQCIEVFNVFVNDEMTFFLQTEDSDKEEPDNRTGELVQQAAVSVESEQNPEESVDKPEDEPEPEPEEDMADTVSGVVCNESDLKDGE